MIYCKYKIKIQGEKRNLKNSFIIILFILIIGFIAIGLYAILNLNIKKSNSVELKISTIDNYKYTISKEKDIEEIMNILENAEYEEETCDGIPDFYIETENGIYMIESEYCHIRKDSKEATISQEEMKQIVDIIKKG